MKSMQQIPLSVEGSFEHVVNQGTSAARQKNQVWLNKTFRTIVVLMAVLLINILLWLFRVIPSVPSVYVSEILTCGISFLAGRIYEKFCK